MSLLQSPFPSSRDLLTIPSALFSMGWKLLKNQNRKHTEAHGIPESWFCFSSGAYNSEMPTSLCHRKLSTSEGTDAKVPNEKTPEWWSRISPASGLPELGAGMQRWAEFRAASRKNWGCVRTQWDIFWAVVPGGCIWVQPNIPSS